MRKRIQTSVGALVLVLSLLVGCGAKEGDVNSTQGTENQTQGTEENKQNNSDISTDDEYANFAIANTTSYVNVRSKPTTESEIVGKIFDDSVAEVLEITGENKDWYKIVSGSVKGYIKADYFYYGEEALKVLEEVIVKFAKVKATRLNVRAEQSTSSERIGYVDNGEQLKVIENCGEWIKVQYGTKTGYVYAEYVDLIESYVYAKTLEEESKEIAYNTELDNRVKAPSNTTQENTTIIKPSGPEYKTNAELRKAIVNMALQYVGDPYVHGGQSLETGTDCSGFTMLILAKFGYNISRIPQGQYTSAGRPISYSQVQPGDIICYSKNGSTCTHVGFYIGDGKIVHAASTALGVIISPATYTTIFGVRNVID